MAFVVHTPFETVVIFKPFTVQTPGVNDVNVTARDDDAVAPEANV